MKTSWLKEKDIKRQWFLIDLNGIVLGRAATRIAGLIMGKGKVNFVPNMDCGDYVVAVNASKIAVTGKKLKSELYHRHSGYPGGLKTFDLQEMLSKHPERVIVEAVKNMLPNNKLRDKMLTRLHVFAGEEHSHTAQKPTVVDLKS